jgi:hypothetical protein
MLRRKQVMISDWLDDFVQYTAQKYDISYSEVLRLGTAYFLADVLSKADPKYKMKVTSKEISKVVYDGLEQCGDVEVTRKLIADIYHESKRILQARIEDVKKKNRFSTST